MFRINVILQVPKGLEKLVKIIFYSLLTCKLGVQLFKTDYTGWTFSCCSLGTGWEAVWAPFWMELWSRKVSGPAGSRTPRIPSFRPYLSSYTDWATGLTASRKIVGNRVQVIRGLFCPHGWGKTYIFLCRLTFLLPVGTWGYASC
jgi:hypothetical protein